MILRNVASSSVCFALSSGYCGVNKRTYQSVSQGHTIGASNNFFSVEQSHCRTYSSPASDSISDYTT